MKISDLQKDQASTSWLLHFLNYTGSQFLLSVIFSLQEH